MRWASRRAQADRRTLQPLQAGSDLGSLRSSRSWQADVPVTRRTGTTSRRASARTGRPIERGGMLGKMLGKQGDTSFSGGWSRAFERRDMSTFTGTFGANPGMSVTATRSVANGNLTAPLLFRDGALGGRPSARRRRQRCMPSAPVYPIVSTVNGQREHLRSEHPDAVLRHVHRRTAARARPQVGARSAIRRHPQPRPVDDVTTSTRLTFWTTDSCRNSRMRRPTCRRTSRTARARRLPIRVPAPARSRCRFTSRTSAACRSRRPATRRSTRPRASRTRAS